jgi:hypothetical protein
MVLQIAEFAVETMQSYVREIAHVPAPTAKCM